MNTFRLAMRNLPTYRTPPQLLDFLEQLFPDGDGFTATKSYAMVKKLYR
jgi:hypothetical protein